MVNAYAIASPIECALCEKVKQELDDMEAAAILRGVALDMELGIKRRAVKYLSEDRKQNLLLLGGGDITDFILGEYNLPEMVRSVHANGKLDDFLADVELSRAEFPQLLGGRLVCDAVHVSRQGLRDDLPRPAHRPRPAQIARRESAHQRRRTSN